MGIFDRFYKRMGNNCSRKPTYDCAVINDKDEKPKLQSPPGKFSKKSCGFGHRRLGSTASTVSGDDIKLVWANSKDSSNFFDQLGAKDIFKRFNSFLESWKCWQDDERECKEMLGFDLEMKLVDSLCVIPSGMRLGLGCGSSTEDYDFYLDVDPSIQLNEISEYLLSTFQKAIDIFKSLTKQMKILIDQGDLICHDLTKILHHLEKSDVASYQLPLGMQQLDNPEQLKEALTLVKGAVVTLKSCGSTITNYIMQHGHNVDTVVSNRQSANPTLVIFPRKTNARVKVREMSDETFVKLNQGEDDEKYIEISLK
ncbi:uncharacterized protein LOC114522062 [Dendronephthya gigantea]|uniref:uncharacterized protein LOC114522062 n=1 Tax=Dendronephthya gigantea TaxID=151771 RepID=UPI00106AA7BB|nr:uncharacterized protein LOC114522062 [Dendronephthya gigantea]